MLGQTNVVTIPQEMTEEDKETLQDLGVKFGDLAPGNDNSVYVTLPTGWSKRYDEIDPLHAYLVDNKGRVRVAMSNGIRDCLSVLPQFYIGRDYTCPERHGHGNTALILTDGGKTIFRSMVYSKDDAEAENKMLEVARQFVRSRCRGKVNPLVY